MSTSAPTSLYTPRYTTTHISFDAPPIPGSLQQAPERFLFAQPPTELLNPTELEPPTLNEPTAKLLDPNDTGAEGFRIDETPSHLSWDWSNKPVYVVSPVNQIMYGEVAPPPPGQFYDEDSLYAEVLEVLARLARPEDERQEGEIDCGLYEGHDNFDPDSPGSPLKSGEAFVRLRMGLSVYLLPQYGDHEIIGDMDALATYMYQGQT
jgi:hypothetical protein